MLEADLHPGVRRHRPTKTLAKIASKLCKRYPKLKGGCYMLRPQDIEKVLKNFLREYRLHPQDVRPRCCPVGVARQR